MKVQVKRTKNSDSGEIKFVLKTEEAKTLLRICLNANYRIDFFNSLKKELQKNWPETTIEKPDPLNDEIFEEMEDT